MPLKYQNDSSIMNVRFNFYFKGRAISLITCQYFFLSFLNLLLFLYWLWIITWQQLIIFLPMALDPPLFDRYPSPNQCNSICPMPHKMQINPYEVRIFRFLTHETKKIWKYMNGWLLTTIIYNIPPNHKLSKACKT